jgi:hypothetical protein
MMRVQFYGELVEEMYDSCNSMGRHTFLNFVTILDPAGAEVVAFFRIRGGPRARVACLPGVANARRSAARAGAPTFSGASGPFSRFAGPPLGRSGGARDSPVECTPAKGYLAPDSHRGMPTSAAGCGDALRLQAASGRRFTARTSRVSCRVRPPHPSLRVRVPVACRERTSIGGVRAVRDTRVQQLCGVHRRCAALPSAEASRALRTCAELSVCAGLCRAGSWTGRTFQKLRGKKQDPAGISSEECGLLHCSS